MTPINVTIARIDLWDNNSVLYCGASLALPASRGEIQDAMDRARITAGQPYKIVDCIDGNGYEMDYLPENPPLDVWNILAYKLSEMEDYEHNQFIAMCRMEKEPPSMMRLLNITENMQDCICIPAKNYAELGEFYLDNEMIDQFVNLPSEVYKCLDPARVGKMQSILENGTFFEINGYKFYAVNHADEFRKVYSKTNMPKLPDEEPGYVFKLNVRHKDGGNSVWITLPAQEYQLSDLIKNSLGAHPGQCEIIEGKCSVPNMPGEIFQLADIGTLNTIAHKISGVISEGEYPKYKALLEGVPPESVNEVIEQLDAIGDYEFFPEVSCAEDYGREIFCKTHHINPDDPSLKPLQFGGYGEAMMKKYNAVQTNYGFVCKSGELYQDQTQGSGTAQGMGGIC